MATAPAGTISKARENLRQMLAATSAFQIFVGAFDAATALNRIHDDAPPAPLDGNKYTLDEWHLHRPFAVVHTFNIGLDDAGGGSFTTFDDSGSLGLEFERDIPPEIGNDPAEIARRFENEIGGIVDGLAALSGQAPYLAITAIRMDIPWTRTSEEEIATYGDSVQAKLVIEWGTG